MFKKTLLFSMSAALGVLILSSYASGPITNNLGNRTGSAGSTGNCSSGGCHATNNTNTILSVSLVDGSTPVTNGKYVSGHTYHVMVTGGVTNANLPRFGFQISCVKTSNAAQAGTFSLNGATQVAVKTSGALQFVEHTAPIQGTGSGTTWAYSKQFDWTAPASGSGQVKFYLSLNAVNFNGSDGGDQPNNTSVSYDENTTTGVENIEASVFATAYPNPIKDQMHIVLDNALGSYGITAYDMQGRKVYEGGLTHVNGKTETAISTQSWSNGLYHIKISKDGLEKILAVVKQ